tara:strand:+ start:418 stop:1566 length:1149 start_codon:yes stop_codon:yes gene_type:complete
MPNPNGGLITETNAQYYSGQQGFIGGAATTSFVCNFNTDLANAVVGASNANYTVTVNGGAPGAFTMTNNTITFGAAPPANSIILVTLSVNALRSNYGGYQYTSLNDIINNFMVAYVGAGKLIPSVKRTDIIFHAKRGMQEFSYDTLKSIKSQELTMSPSLTAVIPQDYVNYVRLSWIDNLGVKRVIYPNNNLTINPAEALLQDDKGLPIQDNFGENVETDPPETVQRWRKANGSSLSGTFNNTQLNQGFDYWGTGSLGGVNGQRYGSDPQLTQTNGWFGIDEVRGVFTFSSNLKGVMITIEYISDGLAYDLDTRVPKMIEDAMYSHISHAIIASRINQPEYVVNRLKRERSAKLRNAKIRLSNIKLGEIVQVMRGKSKWIKS